ncbi:hypothetical protein Tco_0386664 [Tanacetum coccineum]
MSASNQQTLADSGANERPPMLEKMNYIPWESKFRRFLDNKLKEEEWMWHSVEKGPYVRPMIPDPDDTREQIIEPLSKMTEINKKQYIADVRSHANPSYLNSSQPYYVTHPSLVVDYEEDYQGELQGDSQEEKITTAMMLLARAITQKFSTPSNNPDDNAVTEPTYDAKAVSEVNISHKMIPKGVYEHKNHGKRKTVINTSDDDQIDSNIIFNDPYVENNSGTSEHDLNAHEEYHDIQILAYNVQREAKNKK